MRCAALLGVAAAIAGCTSIAQAPPIGGTEWRVTALNGEAIDATGTKAAFRDDDFIISFGCNTGQGSYRVEGDRLIPIDGVTRTEMACVPADNQGPNLMAREDRGFAIASRPMRIDWHDTRRVTLTNEAGSIELRR